MTKEINKPPEEHEIGEAIIHLYSPYSYHGSSAIVLNEKGRQKLINALQKREKVTILDVFVEGGEGYSLGVFVLPEREIRKMQDPYLHAWNDNHLADPRDEIDIRKSELDRVHA